MGAFDAAKAKLGQGAGYVEKKLPTAEAKGIGELSKGVGKVLDFKPVAGSLNVINKAQTLVKGVSGLVNDIKSIIQDPTLVLSNPLLMGWSRKELISLLERVSKIHYAQQNQFLIRIEDPHYPFNAVETIRLDNGVIDPTGKGYGVWDMFAMSVSFSQVAHKSDEVALGATFSDNLQGAERREFRVTFLDNAECTIKNYFGLKAAQALRRNGLVQPPSKYAFYLRVIYLNPKNDKLINVWTLNDLIRNSNSQRCLVRVANLEVDLNKREDGLQELQATFVEVDPFMSLS